MSLHRRFLEATLAVVLGSLACTSEAPGPVEAEAPPSVTPVAQTPKHPSVRFTNTLRFVDETGQATDSERTFFGAMLPGAALAPDGAGGFRTSISESVDADGYIVIPDVPEGPYYLRTNDNYHWTTAREQQHVVAVAQRVNLEWNPPGTSLQLHVAGLLPWKETDVLRLSAPNGGPSNLDVRLITPLHYGGTLPTVGATQLDALTAELAARFDGAKGDSLWVQQLSERPAAGSSPPYTAVVRSFRQPAFSLLAGTGNALDLTLAGGPERSVSFELDLAAFDAVAEGAHPEASGPKESRRIGHDWAIRASPGAEPLAKVGSPPALAFAAVSMDLDRAAYDVAFLDAFPQDWLRVLEVSSGALVTYTVRDEGFMHPFHLYRYDTLEAGVAAGPLAPRLGPVRNLRVNGLDAARLATGVGASPVVSWDPPALGTAERYFVSILRYGSYSLSESRNYLITTGTALQLPPEVVPSGSFVIKVTATHGAGTFSPHEGTLPLDVAEAGTGMLRR